MRHHALTDAAFGALAAGRPSHETLSELRKSQLSRRRLLLFFQYAGEQSPRLTDPRTLHRHLTDPLFGAWAVHQLKSPGDAPPEPHLPPGGGVFLEASHDGLSIRVRLEDADPRRALLGLTPTPRLTEIQVAYWRVCFATAWQRLVTRHRPQAELLTEVLQLIVPVVPDPAARGISATSADAFGAVAMSTPPDAAALAVGLLHETAHSLLNAVTQLFDLHTAPGTLGYSPWRDDPRPASGILHGAYAYLAVARFWRTESAADPANRLAAFEYARWREAVTIATETLLTAAELTPAGRRFVTALHHEAAAWLTEPVDPEVQRLATAANRDHHLRWRLRNLKVAPADAQTLAGDWRRGALPTPAALTSTLVPAPRRALENSARLNLIHTLLRPVNSPRTTQKPADPPTPRHAEPRLDPQNSRSWSASGPRGSTTNQDLPALPLAPTGTRPRGDSQTVAGVEQADGSASEVEGARAEEIADAARSAGTPQGGGTTQTRSAAQSASAPQSSSTTESAAQSAGESPACASARGGNSAGGRATAGDVAWSRGAAGAAVRAYLKALEVDLGDDAAWAGLFLILETSAPVEIVAAVCRDLARDAALSSAKLAGPVEIAGWISGSVYSCP